MYNSAFCRRHPERCKQFTELQKSFNSLPQTTRQIPEVRQPPVRRPPPIDSDSPTPPTPPTRRKNTFEPPTPTVVSPLQILSRTRRNRVAPGPEPAMVPMIARGLRAQPMLTPRQNTVRDVSRTIAPAAGLNVGAFETIIKESVQQHKYAHLAQSSYDYTKKDPFSFKKAGEWIPELRDFEVVEDLSGTNATVLHNPVTGETVISYRGTDPTNKGDLATDAAIIGGGETKTPRFKNAQKLFKRVQERFPTGKKVVTGHSLGGGQSLYIGEKNNVESWNYDPAISFTAAMRNRLGITARQNIVRTAVDPVSALSPVARLFGNKTRRIKIVNQRLGEGISHSHSHMLGEPEFLKDSAGVEILDAEGFRQPIKYEGGTSMGFRKIPAKISITKAGGIIATGAAVLLSAVETRNKIKANKFERNDPYSQVNEVAYVLPGVGGSLFSQGSLEQRALTALGKRYLGSSFHSEADIQAYYEAQRQASDQGTTITSTLQEQELNDAYWENYNQQNQRFDENEIHHFILDSDSNSDI